MAVCLPAMPDPMVTATAYSDVGLQPGGYGQKEANPYLFTQQMGEEQGGIPYSCPTGQLPDGSELQVVSMAAMPQSPWSQPISTDGMPYWQDPNEQTEFCTHGTLGSGGQDGTNEGGWHASQGETNSGSPWVHSNSQGIGMVLPQRGPHGGHGGQPARQKRRFCTSFPDVGMCRRGSTCAFAHSREEIRAPLLSIAEEQQDPAAMDDDFFMYKYKTLWCPIGVQHEWHTCVYAHNYQDARRPVDIGYGARLCPYWSKKDTGAEYSQRCPLGLRCPYSHGAKEQLYHPQYFKTVICRDLRGKACPRQGLCAFFHQRSERRIANASEDVDYSQPLPEEALNNDWVSEFLMPPFLPETSKGNDDFQFSERPARQDGMSKIDMNNGVGMSPYPGPQAPPSPSYAMQQPFVFLLPMNPMPGAPMANSGHQMGPAPMASPAMALPANATAIGSPMGSPMGNHMGGQQWVFVPMQQSQSDQH